MALQFDIVICGGGLVGLSLANALRHAGLTIAVIDSLAEPVLPTQNKKTQEGFDLRSGYTPRVSALNLASVRFLARLGVWQNVKRHCAFKKMSVKDARGTSFVEFDAAEIHEDSLGYIVENQQVIYALANRLKTSDITLKWQAKLDDLDPIENGFELFLEDGTQLDCHLLIGADGGNSRIRELNNMKSLRWSYEQEAFVTTIQTEKSHNNVARQWFTDEGPLAFLPLADDKLCSLVWSVANASSLKEMNPKDLCEQLSAASEFELGQVLGVDQCFSFPLTQQHSLRYIQKNLALIGDAAHTIHPLAGQGANLGFADAQALATELLQYKFENTQSMNIGDQNLLKRYERARRPHNLLMTSTMELFKQLYSSQDPGVGWLRNTGMKLVNDNSLLKTMVTKLASGL